MRSAVRHLPTLLRRLKCHYEQHHAPVVDLMRMGGADPFHILVAGILSTRTRDETTAAVCARLFEAVRSPADLRGFTPARMEALIFPAGFYRTKARHLRALPEVLEEQFGGAIPRGVDELCRLPGVGRKVANLVVAQAFGEPAICVDVHVHRISNRLGLVKTTTPLETETALRQILPVSEWKTWNPCLVSYGQTVCLPRRPRCTACVLRDCCARVGLDPLAAPQSPAR